MRFDFIIYGEPVGKARARVCKTHTYTPAKTVKWEESIKLQAIAALHGKPLLDEPLNLSIVFIRSFPKSMSDKKRLSAKPSSKPDSSNYLKAVEDALNGILWRDDALICDLYVKKCYGDPPRVEISVWTD